MATLRWHIPNYVDTDSPPPVEYASTAELLRLPRVVAHTSLSVFVRWETRPHGGEWLLVFVGEMGEAVIAYLSEQPDLPVVDRSRSIPHEHPG